MLRVIDLFLTVFLASIFQKLHCHVEILQPYHPLFIKVGSTLEIRCVSTDRELEWVRSTPETTWSDNVISPKVGDGWVIRTTNEEPSGFVESVLIKENIQLHDRGTYICRDRQQQKSFSIWVTTLQVYKQNVTAVAGQEQIVAYCILTGFDINPPLMDHEWYFNDKVPIANGKRHKVFVNSTEQNRMGLVINPAYKEDSGWYQCRFTLYTNLVPLDIVDKFYIDAKALKPGNGGNLTSHPPCCISLLLSLSLILIINSTKTM